MVARILFDDLGARTEHRVANHPSVDRALHVARQGVISPPRPIERASYVVHELSSDQDGIRAARMDEWYAR
jgi:hypothetical protein